MTTLIKADGILCVILLMQVPQGEHRAVPYPWKIWLKILRFSAWQSASKAAGPQGQAVSAVGLFLYHPQKNTLTWWRMEIQARRSGVCRQSSDEQKSLYIRINLYIWAIIASIIWKWPAYKRHKYGLNIKTYKNCFVVAQAFFAVAKRVQPDKVGLQMLWGSLF